MNYISFIDIKDNFYNADLYLSGIMSWDEDEVNFHLILKQIK